MSPAHPPDDRKLPERPRMRPVDPTFQEHEGVPLVVLRDPFGLAETIVVELPLFMVATLMDGRRDLPRIQAELLRQFRARIDEANLAAIVQLLDRHHFLEGPAFEEHRREQVEQFRAADVRPALHQGAYGGADAEECRRFLDEQLVREDGPGGPPRAPEEVAKGRDEPARPLAGWIAPHIDLHRGGACYGWIYRDVAERLPDEVDTAVIFGTCHAGQQTMFTLTRKTYETPLGPVETDVALLDALLERWDGSEDLLADEFCHRGEHSIEFQALYLRWLMEKRGRTDRPIKALPILCGSFDEHLVGEKTPPSAHEGFARFLRALDGALRALGRRPVFIAGADLAHVGTRFGDADLPKEKLEQVGREDETMLDLVANLDIDGFYRDMARDENARRVCGFGAITALIGALAGPDGKAGAESAVEGRVLRYEQWYDGESSVTYAGVAFDGERPRIDG